MNLNDASQILKDIYLPATKEQLTASGVLERFFREVREKDELIRKGDIDALFQVYYLPRLQMRDEWKEIVYYPFYCPEGRDVYVAMVRATRTKDGLSFQIPFTITSKELANAREDRNFLIDVIQAFLKKVESYADCACGPFKDEEVGDVFMPCPLHTKD